MSVRAASGPMLAAALGAAIALLASSVAAAAGSYSGVLAQPGVVWISDGSNPAPLPEVSMRNTHKAFVPELLVISTGTNVRFPNDDGFYHSIYSESSADPFDIGFYDTGPGKIVAFPRPGVVEVRCHVHGSMHGVIVVVDGPFAQTSVPGAAYTLAGVRPGYHVLHSWSGDRGERTVTVYVAP